MEKKIEQLTAEAKAKMTKKDKKGTITVVVIVQRLMSSRIVHAIWKRALNIQNHHCISEVSVFSPI